MKQINYIMYTLLLCRQCPHTTKNIPNPLAISTVMLRCELLQDNTIFYILNIPNLNE